MRLYTRHPESLFIFSCHNVAVKIRSDQYVSTGGNEAIYKTVTDSWSWVYVSWGGAVEDGRHMPAQCSTSRARARSSGKLERPAGAPCAGWGGDVGARPVAAVRSEPSLLRLQLLDTSQLHRARHRLNTFCKKLRRTISECLLIRVSHRLWRFCPFARFLCVYYQYSCVPQTWWKLVCLCSNIAFVFLRGEQATRKPLKRPSWLQKRRPRALIVSATKATPLDQLL